MENFEMDTNTSTNIASSQSMPSPQQPQQPQQQQRRPVPLSPPRINEEKQVVQEEADAQSLLDLSRPQLASSKVKLPSIQELIQNF